MTDYDLEMVHRTVSMETMETMGTKDNKKRKIVLDTEAQWLDAVRDCRDRDYDHEKIFNFMNP